MIGDHDPEDVWDDGDPFTVRLHVLERIVDSLRDNRDDRYGARLSNLRRLVDKIDDELDGYRTRLRRVRHDVKRL